MRNKKPPSNASSLTLGPNAEHSSREDEHTVYTSPLEVARRMSAMCGGSITHSNRGNEQNNEKIKDINTIILQYH
jgi:hypothetical protein